MSIGTYSFLPYVRQGLANSIASSGGARGTFTVKLQVQGDSTTTPADDKTIEIYGPGDVVGIDARAVAKTDPHNWITNFEPNYLAFIEFYDEDYPWRYTPAAPAAHRLNPWIALVVLEEGEFDQGNNMMNRPLPYINLKSAATLSFFPRADQLWAWAHVQFNGDLTQSEDTIHEEDPAAITNVLTKLENALKGNPDLGYSRLVCPRKLQPGKTYHAFVIPAYESGRLAGTGSDAATIAAAGQAIAWTGGGTEYPYYYRWQFNTGTVGDFEYLVRLLKPKVADSSVGRRLMDVSDPGANLQWVEDPDPDKQLGGILRLGGALKVPAEALTAEEIAKSKQFDEWAKQNFPAPFQRQLSGFLNLADDYTLKPASQANQDAKDNSGLPIDPNIDADPLITPPIYGRWHAMVERVLADKDGNAIDYNYNWLSELNLDPRFRVPAHMGTRVVQENQENFMEAAWEQVGDVLKANRQIRYGQVAIAAGMAWHEKHFAAAGNASAAKALLLTAPLQKRVLLDGATVFHTVKESMLPGTLLSAPMRRIVRPRGRLAHHLQKQLPDGEHFRLEAIVDKVSSGVLLPAPPKTLPSGMPSTDKWAAALTPAGIPAWLKDYLYRYPWLKYLPLLLAMLIILLLLLTGAQGMIWKIGITAAVILVYLWWLLMQWTNKLQLAEAIQPEQQLPEKVDDLPASPDFHLPVQGETFTPSVRGTTDSTDSTRFKAALKDMFYLLQYAAAAAPKEPVRPSLNLSVMVPAILGKIRPEKTVPAWTWQYIVFPDWIKAQLSEDFVEAMAYPKINTPMYEALNKISSELFLPNINKIEQNSITLLQTNQPFIESYMVGLNHEFARELLWREYPTDQRGSYFRQFWDVSSILKDPALADKTEAEKREPYYDIPKLHEWRRHSKLGEHDHRQAPGAPPKDEVVLVIRGELLKKYPTAVIYAHKAQWTKNETTGDADIDEPRSLKMPEEGDKEKPSTDIIRTPLYQAKVAPDIYFFGFDLGVTEARGEGAPDTPDDANAGWFFVIKERPGEPRFGLDTTPTDGGASELVTWNDLDWAKVVPGESGVIDVLALPAPLTLPATPPDFTDSTEDKGREEQYNDDIQVTWSPAIDAASLAYILYQVPMMVCVHASEMLLKKN